MLVMFSIIFLGTLTSGWLHFPVLSGASFVAGCVLAAWPPGARTCWWWSPRRR